MKRLALKTVVVSIVLVGAACSGDGSEESSTTVSTTTTAPVTSLGAAGSTEAPTTSTAPPTSVTTSTVAGEPVEFPDYTIFSREAGENGDTVVVLLDTESYDSLTDIDLANVLADVVDRFPPVLTAYVVDDEAAADAVLLEEPTEAELELLDRHYLVRLEDGFRMVFAGPFADTPIAILGS